MIPRRIAPLLSVAFSVVLLTAVVGCASPSTSQPSGVLGNLLSGRAIQEKADNTCPNFGAHSPVLSATNSTIGAVARIAQTKAAQQRLGVADGGAKNSEYAAICIYSAKEMPPFATKYRYVAWWAIENGSDGVIAAW